MGAKCSNGKLDRELREAWLNPPDLVKRVPEVVPGFPDRILPVDDDPPITNSVISSLPF